MHDLEHDRPLIDGVRHGDERACEQFDRRFRGRLIQALRRRGVAEHDADDIVQDTLVAALAQLQQGRFEERCSLGAWVWAIFSRRLSDHRRSRLRHERAAVSLEASGPPIAAPRGVAVLRAEAEASTRLLVREAMAALPPRERLILLLNVQGGRPTREIAGLLRLGVKTTEALLTSAKKRFRACLAEREEIASPRRLKE